ncbi:MFS transporter [Euryarchaeota archaeon]|nr:MFS transporter [Euryarchaeota archaeon]|tara:strand:+ start:4564 stop:5817 length:1254 start_codon:yes stop_codon:yes gene_type:complete
MAEVSYIGLLRSNKAYRRLFTANEISYIGDWFSMIALFLLAGEASDNSPLAIAGVLATRSFTFAPLEPLTGMLADRYPRKWLMVIGNVWSFAILVLALYLGLLDSLLSVYLLGMAMVVGRAISSNAESAYVPNICTRDELLSANALSSGGWSAAMGIGAGIGGLTISKYGIETALWIDSLTFLIAILLILTLPHGGPKRSGRDSEDPSSMLDEIWSGWKYILSKPPIRRVVLAKAMWASGGGAQVFLLILIGNEAGFGDVAAGIGILYMARGFGSGFGPIISRRLMANERLIPYLLGGVLIVSGAFYMAVAASDWTMVILAYVFISHAASGVNWVLSTTMLQKRSEDEWLGRVFGTDSLGITMTMGLSTVAAGLILENDLLTLRETIIATGALQIMAGILWILLATPEEKKMLDQAI